MKIFDYYKIDIPSFFRRKPKDINDEFGVSLITGYQGSGKTYFSVYITVKYLDKNKKIKTNIRSLKIPDRTIEYFEKLEDIESDIETDVIYIIDEISKRYTKEARQDKAFYSWLQQSRKRRRTVLLITQEYLQVPLWLRPIARYVYTTTKFPLFPIFRTYRGYAVLSEETKEWEIEPENVYIYKRNKYICSYYDTMEPIQIL